VIHQFRPVPGWNSHREIVPTTPFGPRRSSSLTYVTPNRTITLLKRHGYLLRLGRTNLTLYRGPRKESSNLRRVLAQMFGLRGECPVIDDIVGSGSVTNCPVAPRRCAAAHGKQAGQEDVLRRR